MNADLQQGTPPPAHHILAAILGKLLLAGLGLLIGLAAGLFVGAATGLIPFLC